MNANFEYYKVFYYVSKYENLTKAACSFKDQSACGDKDNT